eukprot:1144606-Pelagomonas_calceolata.AAC.1
MPEAGHFVSFTTLCVFTRLSDRLYHVLSHSWLEKSNRNTHALHSAGDRQPRLQMQEVSSPYDGLVELQSKLGGFMSAKIKLYHGMEAKKDRALYGAPKCEGSR